MGRAPGQLADDDEQGQSVHSAGRRRVARQGHCAARVARQRADGQQHEQERRIHLPCQEASP